jgi:thioesterase domain-containing protein/acyl carrier protein
MAATTSTLAILGHYLPSYMVPVELVGLETMPTSPSGKVDRGALPAPSIAPAITAGAAHEVFNPVELRVRTVWEEVLGLPIASPDEDFFALGGHSLLAVRLFARLESVFGSAPPLSSLFSHPTIRAFATIVADSLTKPAGIPVVTLKGAISAAPLMLVHGAGAGLLWGYTNLARHCDTPRSICAFAPELSVDASSPGRMEDMAARYVARLRTIQPHGPYHLAGYCFGGNLAYEMARQLSAEGESIGLLAVFDSTPSNSEYHRVRLTPRFVLGFITNLSLALWEFAGLSWRDKGRRSRTVLQKFFRGSRDGIEAQVAAMIPDRALYTAQEMKLWEAHLRLLHSYRPQPAPLRVVLLRTRRRPLWRSHEPTLGWGALAQAGVKIELVAGNHGTLFHEPHVVSLAAKLRDHLAEQAGTGTPVSPSSSGLGEGEPTKSQPE